jgi:hypothetical protein
MLRKFVWTLIPTALICLCVNFVLFAEEKKGEEAITPEKYLEHVTLLAGDKYNGRKAGTEFEALAADYVREQFKKIGLKSAPGANEFLQEFDLPQHPDASKSFLKITAGEKPAETLRFNPEFLYMSPCVGADFKGEAVHVVFGTNEGKFESLDKVKGKLVFLTVLQLNKKDAPPVTQMFGERVKLVEEAGAAGIVCLSNDLSVNFLGAFSAGKIPCLVMSPKAAEKLLPGFNAQKTGEEMMGKVGPAVKEIPSLKAELKIESVQTKSRNVVGYLEGTDLKEQYVIIGSHMDHLGAVEKADGKKDIYRGADDNASGVSGVIELARAFATCDPKPRRSIVFIAFGSEEIGVIGSQYYVNHPLFPLDKVQVMINLDMIGRNSSNTITVSSLGSGKEIEEEAPQINENFGGILIKPLPNNVAGGDHTSFYIKKVPVIFFCDMGHLDYHKPTDTADKISSDFGQSVTRLAYQYADLFANRDGKITYQVMPISEIKASSRDKRISLGIVPDFAYSGVGERAADVTPDGYAIKVGIKAGDVIIKIDEFEVKEMQTYMTACEKVKGRPSIKVTVQRDGKEMVFEIKLQ